MDIKIPLNIEKLKDYKQHVFILIVLVLAGFFGKKIFDKQNSQMERKNNQINNYEQVSALASDIDKLSQEFDKFKGLGWLTKESVEIMGEVNSLVAKHNLEIVSFDPGNFSNFENYTVFSMQLKIKSDYFSLVRFLSEVEELKKLTKVVSLQVSPQGDTSQEEGPLVYTELSLNAFILKN